MSEEMGMKLLGYSNLLSVVLNYLLNPSSAVPFPVSALKQVPIIGMRGQMRLQDQSKRIRKQNVSVLIPFTMLYEDLPCLDIHVINRHAGQLAHPNRCVKQQPKHYLVLEVSSLVYRFIERFQARLRQELGQAAGSAGPPQFHLLPYLPTDQVELLIRQSVLAHKSGERGNEFRFVGCGLETWGGRALHASILSPKRPPSFAFWQFCETLF
jgi:hypothetical protein